MADRVLTWFVKTPIEVGASVNETFEMDDEYVPVRIWCHVNGAPSGNEIIVDVHYQETPSDTPTSIFTSPKPGVQRNAQVGDREYFTDFLTLKKGGLVSLDIDQVGSGQGGKSLTVQLELERTLE